MLIDLNKNYTNVFEKNHALMNQWN